MIEAGEVVSALVERGFMADVTGRMVLRLLREAEGTDDWPLLHGMLTDWHERLLHDAGL